MHLDPPTRRPPRSFVPAALAITCAGLLSLAAVPASAADPIEIHIRDNRFHPDVVEVPAHTKVRLRVINDGAEAEEFESYELNREKIIRPGGAATIFLPPLKPGEYGFFGEFHPETAQGKIIAR
jgi:plastocyanin